MYTPKCRTPQPRKDDFLWHTGDLNPDTDAGSADNQGNVYEHGGEDVVNRSRWSNSFRNDTVNHKQRSAVPPRCRESQGDGRDQV